MQIKYTAKIRYAYKIPTKFLTKGNFAPAQWYAHGIHVVNWTF